ncbi:MAG: efflux RND transporter periplasmic adaptor subunit [Cyanobacteria bacterium J06636_16]
MKNQALAKGLLPLRRWLWMLLLLGSILLLLRLLGGLLSLSPRQSREDAVTNLTTPVTQETLTLQFEGSGTVVSIDTVNLSPKATGELEALYVEQGDAVQAGQVLAQMDTGSLQAELEQRQAQLAQSEAEYARVLAGDRQEAIRRAEAQVEAARSQQELTTTQLTRFRNLAAQGAISQNDLDQYVNEAQVAEANLNEAQEQLDERRNGSRPEDIVVAEAAADAARAQVAIIQTELDDAQIVAPFDGIVKQTYATVGAIVTPTTSASATASATSSSILALSSGLEVEIDVAEANIGQVSVGQSVEILADAFPNQPFEGEVRRIAPEAVIENNVTTFQVMVELRTGFDQLRSGMTVDAIFIGDAVSNALTVPTVAIATEAGELGVRVPDEAGDPVFQPITVGLTQGNKTQVLSGLEMGDRVFLDLPEGMQSNETVSPLP